MQRVHDVIETAASSAAAGRGGPDAGGSTRPTTGLDIGILLGRGRS